MYVHNIRMMHFMAEREQCTLVLKYIPNGNHLIKNLKKFQLIKILFKKETVLLGLYLLKFECT